MKIAIDFDGTIVDHRYPDIGTPVPGAFEWMKKWSAAGAKLILYTMRSDGSNDGPTLSQAVDFCRANGVSFWGINADPGQLAWTTSSKAFANLYVDDAAFGCPLRANPRMGGRPFVDWDVVGPAVMAMLEKA